MDAIEFIKQLRRMDEKGVPKNRFIYLRVGRETDSPEDVVAEVEEWVKMNPVKTRQSVFLGNYPCARIDRQSVLYACPADVYGDNVCPKKKDAAPITCYECRREFWSQEVE